MSHTETTPSPAAGRRPATRGLWTLLALAGVAGFAIGWLAFASRPGPASPGKGEGPAPEPRTRVAARQAFPLRPADQFADRETPALAVAPDGQIVLAFASQTGDAERTLYLTRSADGGQTFADPEPWRRVPIYRFRSEAKGDRPPMAFSTHVLPRLAAGRETVELGWVEAIDGGPTVAYFVARSVDGGRTFSEPVPAHGVAASRPGFTALATGADGSVLCGWLDGRDRGQQPFVSAWPADSEGFGPEQRVFAGPGGQGVCPCCDVAVTRVPGGATFVAFRNNDAGHRDIWLARSPAESRGFEPPIPVSPDRWAFDGCPHDGPALALARGRLHLAWMDAHTGHDRVYLASTSPTDLAFTLPRELSPDSSGSQGHPRLVADATGRLHAVWDEALGDEEPPLADHEHGHGPRIGGGRAVKYAASIGDGSRFGPAVALDPRPGVFQTQPALTVGPDGAVSIAWNEFDADGKQVVFVRLNPEDRHDRTGP